MQCYELFARKWHDLMRLGGTPVHGHAHAAQAQGSSLGGHAPNYTAAPLPSPQLHDIVRTPLGITGTVIGVK